jgi:hypothetical protein
MTKEQKELLIKDLCARLPYGVKLQNINDIESIGKLRSIDLDDYCCEILFYTYQGKALTICDRSKLFRFGTILRYKPCLFPLSSMTEEQENKWYEVFINPLSKRLEDRHTRQEDLQLRADAQAFGIEYLLKNHFDIHGLIPMGLAIDATNLNIY